MSARRNRTPEQIAEATARNNATADRIEAYVERRAQGAPRGALLGSQALRRRGDGALAARRDAPQA